MARHLPILNGTATQQPASTRSSHVRLGVWIELVTILWMTIEAEELGLHIDLKDAHAPHI